MAYLYRLIFCLFAFFPSFSFAYPAIPTSIKYSPHAFGFTNYLKDTPEDACVFAMNAENINGWVANRIGTGSNPCEFSITKDGSTVTRSYVMKTYAPSCGTGGGTLSGSSCTCPSGHTDNGSACVAPTDNELCSNLVAGLNYLKAPLLHFGPVSLTACFGGYVMSGQGGAGGGGHAELYGPFSCAGESAQSCSVVPNPSSDLSQCAQGSFPGQVNGVQVCLPPSGITTAPEKTTATPPASGASAPSIPDAPTGTASTEKSTTCTGTTCITTTTYRDGAGASLGQKNEAKPITSFCQENPKAPGCKELVEGTFSGRCGSATICTGDAVMCAIAAATFASNCALSTAPADSVTTENTAYDTAKTVTGNQTSELAANTSLTISSASFNQTELLGAAQGMADVTVVVMGRTIVLPFSSVNVHLDTLGRILQAVTFLMCAVIVSGLRSRG